MCTPFSPPRRRAEPSAGRSASCREKNRFPVLLPAPERDTEVTWTLNAAGESHTIKALWKKPREWTFYVMLSSHTDIGLHNSQYHQRYMSEDFSG